MNPQIRRLALDLGPLFLFFASFQFAGIFVATGIFMVAVLAALGLGWHLEKKLSPIPLITAILVMIFGGLTLYLHNDVFIKMKPTILYAIFGAVLLGGLLFNRLFIKYVFAEAFDLTEKGWRGLTWRWGIFFLILAVLNETIWRNTSTATWVAFKVWGIMSLIFLFALAQTPFLFKHHIDPET
jgi:intracellular septation protein